MKETRNESMETTGKELRRHYEVNGMESNNLWKKT